MPEATPLTPEKMPAAGHEEEKGQTLLTLARGEIAKHFGHPEPRVPETPWLMRPGATFVTLTLHGELRGCIGSLEARRPLHIDVRANALAAAFQDPRFSPLRREEFEIIRVEVSLLTPAEPLAVASEAEARRVLRPGVDGVIFEYGRYRSTFLPQVWEQLPDPAQFLAHLKLKAGLPPDFWAEGVRLSRYGVSKWKEQKEDER